MQVQLIISGAPKSPKIKTPKRRKSIEGGGIVKLEQLTTDQGGNDKKKKKSSDGGDTAKTAEVSGDQGGITIVEHDTGAGGDKESEEKGTVYFLYIITLHPLR